MTKTKLSFLLTLIASLLATPALADTFVYGGSQCGPYSYTDTNFSRNNGLYNTLTGTTRTAYCPIVRNNATNTTGLTSASVVVSDVSTTANVTCTIYSINTAYTTLDFESRSSSGSSGLQTLSYSSVTSSSSTSWYEMSCSMPYNTYLRRYSITEP